MKTLPCLLKAEAEPTGDGEEGEKEGEKDEKKKKKKGEKEEKQKKKKAPVCFDFFCILLFVYL